MVNEIIVYVMFGVVGVAIAVALTALYLVDKHRKDK